LATPKPIGYLPNQNAPGLPPGNPTGEIVFIALPEATFVALSDAAQKRGMNVAQALAAALDEFLRPKE